MNGVTVDGHQFVWRPWSDGGVTLCDVENPSDGGPAPVLNVTAGQVIPLIDALRFGGTPTCGTTLYVCSLVEDGTSMLAAESDPPNFFFRRAEIEPNVIAMRTAAVN